MKNTLFILLYLFYFINGNCQGVPNKIREPLETSNYSKSLYDYDSENSLRDLIFGKSEISSIRVVKELENSERSIFVDADVNPAEIFDYLEDPSKLFFENGKAYIMLQDKAFFLTELELLGDYSTKMSPKNIRIKAEEFGKECITKELLPNFLSVDFDYNDKDGMCAITAYKILGLNKNFLMNRVNFCTVKLFNLNLKNDYCFNYSKCLYLRMNLN